MDQLRIRMPDDFHLHLRQGALLREVAPLSANHFARGLVMPNTTPPVLTSSDAQRYRSEVEAAAGSSFTPLMTIKITGSTTPEIVAEAAASGVVAGKLYPEGVTTNSQDGVRDIESLHPVFDAMAAAGMVLCIHGESPGVFILDREADFVTGRIPGIAAAHPDLRIVLEHVSTAAAVEWVATGQRIGNVAATITVQHLMITLDDVIGDMLEPHNFCKPIAKRPEDRAAVVAAATGESARFFLGTDSAPHPRDRKECASGCAGVFTAPIALPLVASVFEAAGALDRLEAFCSERGADFYGLGRNEGWIDLVRRPSTVPAQYGEVVPFLAGRTLDWSVAGTSGTP